MTLTKDVVIVGAGAAGMMCAIEAAKRGRSVLLIDHSAKLAEKIRISGGGRCNFTNLHTKPENFVSANPHFCRSALARFTPQDFIALLKKHGIRYHEKKLGQLFCDDSAQQIISMLSEECDAAGVAWQMPSKIENISQVCVNEDVDGKQFVIKTDRNTVIAQSLVIATGGLSIPQIGASAFGYNIAEQFGLTVTALRPGLVGLTFAPQDFAPFADISGVAIDVEVSCNGAVFRENILFTHRGLSGPAILQISSYWRPNDAIHVNLLPQHDVMGFLAEQRRSTQLLSNLLADFLPKRFIKAWVKSLPESAIKPMKQYHDKELQQMAQRLTDWQIKPSGTVGYKKAEVTQGGVDTNQLSSKTMQAKQVTGLYFIGEVIDVTGHLGGFNFQWAWSSGYAAGQYV
ncbi:MAG: NAD(P)/FAD-dependent oxidoreductase [Nitrosomonas sp.]|nr:NAD(P)/FAD-dependent oxidoreductase [Nitrosomonas sp.]